MTNQAHYPRARNGVRIVPSERFGVDPFAKTFFGDVSTFEEYNRNSSDPFILELIYEDSSELGVVVSFRNSVVPFSNPKYRYDDKGHLLSVKLTACDDTVHDYALIIFNEH